MVGVVVVMGGGGGGGVSVFRITSVYPIHTKRC